MFKVFLLFKRNSDKIFALLTGKLLLKTLLIISVTLKNSRGERERAKRSMSISLKQACYFLRSSLFNVTSRTSVSMSIGFI